MFQWGGLAGIDPLTIWSLILVFGLVAYVLMKLKLLNFITLMPDLSYYYRII